MRVLAKVFLLIGLAMLAFFAATHAYTAPVAQLPLPTPIPSPTPLTRPINKAALVWPKTQDECARFGGRWGNYGRGTFFQCEISTSDWGSTCTDSNQCEGECLYFRGNPPQPLPFFRPLYGTCSYTRPVFHCYDYLAGGELKWLCVD